ncbi:MAG: ATP-dependent Clp protease ATP-binding subunit ClpX, partial [Chloroflexi bacterium]|nr:ATP-dependent Clp protease ATP-binding subunit ClpX [Chloroflexota bacterium]
MTTLHRGSRRDQVCSFCGKTAGQGRRLVAGPGHVLICNECVALCQQVLQQGGTPGPEPPGAAPSRPLVPREVHRRLDEYVVGQERA